jgi:hypothetical protein
MLEAAALVDGISASLLIKSNVSVSHYVMTCCLLTSGAACTSWILGWLAVFVAHDFELRWKETGFWWNEMDFWWKEVDFG